MVSSLASLCVLAMVAAGAAAGPVTEPATPTPPAGGPEGSQDRALGGALAAALSEAEAALADQEPQLAESRLRSALLEGWLLWGALEEAAGREAEAREALERALRSTFVADRAIRALARHELRAGRPQDAATRLRPHLTRMPGDVEARLLLARALIESGAVDEAVQELEESLAASAGDPEVLFTLATGYLRRNDVAAADRLLERLAKERPAPQTWVLIGRTYRDFGEDAKARAALERALELDPKVRRAYYYLGTVELAVEGRANLDAVAALFRKELEVSPGDPVASLYLGMTLVEQRRFAEAEAPLRVALHHPSTVLEAQFHLGRAFLGLDRFGEAAAALQAALGLIEAKPAVEGDEQRTRQLAGTHYQLALALRRLGDEPGAATHFAEAERFLQQLTRDSRERLADYLGSAVEHEGGAALLALVDVSPVEALPLEARERLRAQVSDQLARAHLNLGVLHARAERFVQAADTLQLAVSLEPELPRAQYSLGVAAFNAGRFAEAAGALELALSREPGNETVRRMLALASLNSEEYGRAAQLLEPDPRRASDPSLQYAYGLALARSERAAEAEAVFAELLATHAEWPELHVVLGQALAERGDFEGAKTSLRRALELRPEVAEAHSTIASMHLRRGELPEAEAELRAELESHPSDVRSRYQLASVLELEGQSSRPSARYASCSPRARDTGRRATCSGSSCSIAMSSPARWSSSRWQPSCCPRIRASSTSSARRTRSSVARKKRARSSSASASSRESDRDGRHSAVCSRQSAVVHVPPMDDRG